MKKVTVNLVVVSGLILVSTALFGQKSSAVILPNPIEVINKSIDVGIEGTWKINKIDGNIVKNELTKTFSRGGVLITKVNGATKKTKWKIEDGKLCIDETGNGFVCCEYKIVKNTLTYTIEGMELRFIR